MPILNCYVSDFTMALLERHAQERGRQPIDLAEAAIENAVMEGVHPNDLQKLREQFPS